MVNFRKSSGHTPVVLCIHISPYRYLFSHGSWSSFLLNLLYSCLTLSVLWCFHFLRSSISSITSLLIPCFLVGIISSAPTMSLASLWSYLSGSVIILLWIYLRIFSNFYIFSFQIYCSFLWVLHVFRLPLSYLLYLQDEFQFNLGLYDDQVVIWVCACSRHCCSGVDTVFFIFVL